MEGPGSRTGVLYRYYYRPNYFLHSKCQLPNARELQNPYHGQRLTGQYHASTTASPPSTIPRTIAIPINPKTRFGGAHG